MASVRLKLKYEGHQPGEVISVPYGKGKELVAAGIGEYPTPVAAAKPTPTPESAELVAARKRAGDLEAENRKLKAENAELKQLLEADAGPGKGDEKPKGDDAAKAAESNGKPKK